MQRTFDQHLAANDGVDRDVEQQPGQHGGNRRRTFRMRVRQPVVQRRESHLGAISDQQKHERQAQHRRLELALDLIEMRPEQRAHALGAQHFLSREIQQDRAEQRLRDAHAAQDEVLPARLEARRRAIQASPAARWKVSRASIATHMRPMLLVVSAISMAAMNSWYML